MGLVLLVCSDLHGSEGAIGVLKEAEREIGPDAVVVCGDVTTYGSADYMEKLLKAFEADMLAVPGNCDTEEMLRMLEDAEVSIHRRRAEVGPYQAFGFGGGLPSSSSMPFEVEEEEMVEGLRSVAVEGGIMVTHTPPEGVNDTTLNGRHLGSKGVMDVVKEFRPALVLSGHVHEARGEVRRDDTVFVNPGPARGGYFARVELGQEIRVELLSGRGRSR